MEKDAFVSLFSLVDDIDSVGKSGQASHQRHLEREGLAEIVRIAMTMNPSGKRKYSEREILNSLFPDEGIVYATGNRG